MRIQELIEGCHLLPRQVGVGVDPVLGLFELSLPLHEEGRVLLQLFTQLRMAGQKGVQLRLTFQKLRVVDQRGIRLQLLSDLRMRIQELVEGCHLLPRQVGILRLSGNLLCGSGYWQSNQADSQAPTKDYTA